MTLAQGAALVALAGVTLYAILGGADFGGGVWDLLATGPRRQEQRDAITHAIGPVWEANHVWLIFVIVTLFTCFPPVFADVATALNGVLALALLGIVLRGAAFVFRNYASDVEPLARAWTVAFGAASILAPFMLGIAAGAIATGRYAWSSPFAVAVGVFALTLCAQVAAVFMLRETSGVLREDFRRRAIRATIAVWIVGAIAALIARAAEPQFFASLTSPVALGAIAVAVVLGIVVMVLVARGRDLAARAAVGTEALAVLAGWYGAQAPALVPAHWTIDSGAAPAATLQAFLIATACGSVFLIPSLLLLFAVFKGPIRIRT